MYFKLNRILSFKNGKKKKQNIWKIKKWIDHTFSFTYLDNLMIINKNIDLLKIKKKERNIMMIYIIDIYVYV